MEVKSSTFAGIAWPLTALIAGLLCAGCVSQMQMPPPPADSRAMLRYTTTGAPGYTHLWHLSERGCPAKAKRELVAGTGPSALLFVDEKEQSKITMLGSSDKAESYVRERFIPTGGRFVYEVNAVSVAVQYVPGFQCTNSGSFVPEPDGQYELYYDVTARGQTCAVTVYKLEPSDHSPFVRTKVDTFKVFYPPRTDAEYCRYVR